jgi:hypothetical protein
MIEGEIYLLTQVTIELKQDALLLEVQRVVIDLLQHELPEFHAVIYYLIHNGDEESDHSFVRVALSRPVLLLFRLGSIPLLLGLIGIYLHAFSARFFPLTGDSLDDYDLHAFAIIVIQHVAEGLGFAGDRPGYDGLDLIGGGVVFFRFHFTLDASDDVFVLAAALCCLLGLLLGTALVALLGLGLVLVLLGL